MNVSQAVKNTRLEKGMTMKAFGALFSPPASDSIVSRWERGVSIPNADRIKQLSVISGLHVSELSKDSITISIEEYESLLEFKSMYEQLCK